MLIEQLVWFVLDALPISKVKVVIIIIEAKVHFNVFSFSLAYFIPKDRL